MKLIVALIVAGLVVVSAGKLPSVLRRQNFEKTQKEFKEYLQEELPAYEAAAGQGNRPMIAELLSLLLRYAKKAEQNNNKVLLEIEDITARLRKQTDKMDQSAWARFSQKFVVAGNRDISFDFLDLCAQGIEALNRSVSKIVLGPRRDRYVYDVRPDLDKIATAIKKARDSLNTQAQVFVENTNEIKALTNWTGSKTKQNMDKIEEAVSKIEKANQNQASRKDTREVISQIDKLRDLVHRY